MNGIGYLKRLIGLCSLTILIGVLGLLLHASPVSAGNCLQDEFSLQAPQKLGCTANDVRVAAVTNIRHLDGTPLTTCNEGEMFNFLADFKVVTSSTSSRSNIGLYFATQNQANALSGTCTDSIIAPQHPCPSDPSIECGSDNYHELDNLNLAPGPDNCGDTSSSDVSPTAGTATEVVTIEIDNFVCAPPAGSTNNQLVLPNCTSWQVPGKTLLCESPSPDFPYNANAIPGSPSKCNCGVLPLNITPVTPMATVSKSCTTAQSTGLNTSCTLSPEGGNVTYTVDITNTSPFGSIVIDQICDSAYGNIFTAATSGLPACPAGSAGTKTGTNCSALTIAPGTGNDQPCTFTASQGENAIVKNTVTIHGHGTPSGVTFGPSSSNQVTVTSGEAASTATITKSLVSITAGCATVRYGVDVKDTSSADEVLTLSALSDNSYGSITSVQGSVLGTTCGVTSGVGSLSGTAGAGTLPATIAVGGDYTCQFDAQFCGTLTSITPAGQPSCNGLQHTNSVTGTLTGDEQEVVTQTANTITVDECFSAFSSSSP